MRQLDTALADIKEDDSGRKSTKPSPEENEEEESPPIPPRSTQESISPISNNVNNRVLIKPSPTQDQRQAQRNQERAEYEANERQIRRDLCGTGILCISTDYDQIQDPNRQACKQGWTDKDTQIAVEQDHQALQVPQPHDWESIDSCSASMQS